MKRLLKITGFFLLFLGVFISLLILILRWVNPPFTAFTLREDWNQLERESYNLRTTWIPDDQLPEHLIWAVVAAEDQLFFEHYGFDFESMEDAWEEHRQGDRTRGASTISQQVAKNLFLSPAQSFIRKGVEAVFTVLIELFWPKERIVEVYLNIAEFGPGLFGIGKASAFIFNCPAQQLTPEMAARFAAVLPNPKQMRVHPPSPYTQERSRWILRQMNQLTGKTFYQFKTDTSAEEVQGVNADSSIQTTETNSVSADSMKPILHTDTTIRIIPDSTIPKLNDSFDIN